jgi:DNA modification methylase
MKLSEIHINPANPRIIKDDRFKKLVKSISEFPKMMELRPIIVDSEGVILGGNMRFKALQELKYKDVPDNWVKRADELTDEEKQRFIIEDNIGFGEWDFNILANDWDNTKLNEWGLDVPIFKNELNEVDKSEEAQLKLKDKFIVPPFSILDTRQGYWQDRKRYWKELIGDNGAERNTGLQTKTRYRSVKGFTAAREGETIGSVLDPVLSEIVNLWFAPLFCNTFDPFAGDTVFGFVSSYLGNSFIGIELRENQIIFNKERTKELNAKYICDDGQNVLKHITPNTQDFLFSCPPYFDLEVYSDLQNDASNQKEYTKFLQILNNTFSDSIKCLKDNRFAVIVIGDVRDKKGNYYRLPDHIKDIFEKNKMNLYNELILIDPIGNLHLRVGKYMEHRKVGKTHQNVLVFFKGDPKKIKNIYPKIKTQIESTDV